MNRSRSAAKPQPQTGGPEPIKRYQLHAEDAEERGGHRTLNPRVCVTRRPLRENPRGQDYDMPNFPDDDYDPLRLTAQVLEFLMSESAGTEN
jgi:hypothetical protein